MAPKLAHSPYRLFEVNPQSQCRLDSIVIYMIKLVKVKGIKNIYLLHLNKRT